MSFQRTRSSRPFGVMWTEGSDPCVSCDGAGTVRRPSRRNPGRFRILDCARCEATGQVPTRHKRDGLTKAQQDQLVEELAARGIRGSRTELAGYMSLRVGR